MTNQPPKQPVSDAGLFGTSPERQALYMLDAFASVGVTHFFLCTINLHDEMTDRKYDYGLERVRQGMGDWLRVTAMRQLSPVIRPYSDQAKLVQLDDLDEAKVERIKSAAFLVYCTSPGRYQAWVAVTDGDKDFPRRLRIGLDADRQASGSTRVSGSLNFKEKYAPSFPRVENVHIVLGRFTNKAELTALGVVGPAAKTAKTHRGGRASCQPGKRKPPLDYQRWLNNPNTPRKDGKPDVSRADFTWCQTCIEKGYSVEETAAMLLEVSEKAKKRGWDYALPTAAAAAEKEGGTPPPM